MCTAPLLSKILGSEICSIDANTSWARSKALFPQSGRMSCGTALVDNQGNVARRIFLSKRRRGHQ